MKSKKDYSPLKKDKPPEFYSIIKNNDGTLTARHLANSEQVSQANKLANCELGGKDHYRVMIVEQAINDSDYPPIKLDGDHYGRP